MNNQKKKKKRKKKLKKEKQKKKKRKKEKKKKEMFGAPLIHARWAQVGGLVAENHIKAGRGNRN